MALLQRLVAQRRNHRQQQPVLIHGCTQLWHQLVGGRPFSILNTFLWNLRCGAASRSHTRPQHVHVNIGQLLSAMQALTCHPSSTSPAMTSNKPSYVVHTWPLSPPWWPGPAPQSGSHAIQPPHPQTQHCWSTGTASAPRHPALLPGPPQCSQQPAQARDIGGKLGFTKLWSHSQHLQLQCCCSALCRKNSR